MDNNISIKERIADNIATRFKQAEIGQSVKLWDGSTAILSTTWNVVQRTPINRSAEVLGSAISITCPEEMKIREAGFDRCHIRCIIEFFENVMVGDDIETELNRMLLDVQTVLYADRNCGELALDIVEIKSELDIDGPGERLMGGMIEVHVIYRHRAGNPRLHI